jgi:argininosuccinate lyase
MNGLFRTRLNKKFDEKTAIFHTSIDEDLRMFEEDIKGTEAHNIMLHEQGIITEKQLSKILVSLESIRKSWRDGVLTISAEFEDIHEFIESTAIEQIGIGDGGLIHTGRSRNDQVMVDMKMVTRGTILQIADRIIKLTELLLERSEENLKTIMLLYTHGQRAQIGTLSHYLLSYVEVFFRDFSRFMDCFKRVNTNPLGGGPIGGTSININRGRTTELLGFEEVQENSIDATSGRDWAVETASVCAILMSNLSRVAADLVLWSSKEFDYVEVSDEFASSSSIMPQKKNPSTIELLRGKTSVAYGALFELLTMVKGLPTGYVQDLQQTKISLWSALDTSLSSLETLIGVLTGINFNDERMLKVSKDSSVYALELCEGLVEKTSLNFREAYTITAALVKQQLNNNQELNAITPQIIKDISTKMWGSPISIKQSFLNKVFDPLLALERRKSIGSPNPEMAKEFISRKKSEITHMLFDLNEKQERINISMKKLEELVLFFTS